MSRVVRDGSAAGGVAFRFSRFSHAYRSRLIDGLVDLQAFCMSQYGVSLARLASKVKFADRVLASYVMHGFDKKKGTKLSLVKHALLGFQHTFPQLRGKLVTCWANLKTWEEQRSSKLRPPLPIPLWLLATGLARAHSRTAHSELQRDRWLCFSVLIEVGLLCMLRPGELQKLTHADVALPGSFVMSKGHAALKITSPKNRRQFGDFQFVLLKHPISIRWLSKIHVEGSEEFLWKGSSREFSEKFKQLMHELGISSLGFTPGSLRPGGATMFYNREIPISTLRFMGRWTVEKSLEHYIQLAMATQIMNRLRPSAIARLQKLSPLCLQQVVGVDLLSKVIDSPPKRGADAEDIIGWCDRYANLA